LKTSPLAMRFLTIRRPVLAAVNGACRAGLNSTAPPTTQFANLLIEGRRQASVKAQGAYKKKSKRGIPKKLGAKRTGGMHQTLCVASGDCGENLCVLGAKES
jgi:large subunit ribosomal protein L27